MAIARRVPYLNAREQLLDDVSNGNFGILPEIVGIANSVKYSSCLFWSFQLSCLIVRLHYIPLRSTAKPVPKFLHAP